MKFHTETKYLILFRLSSTWIVFQEHFDSQEKYLSITVCHARCFMFLVVVGQRENLAS